MINKVQNKKVVWIKFKNYSKQIAIPFKIYADTEYILEKENVLILETKALYILKNTKIIFLVILLINLYVL